ncbi:MAG: NAD(P)H-dependent oxidoreductase [Clostridiales bacterium]|nr:NAD(P)H-dependent oxidoreductase [Clostridiales bacterium]
MSDFILVKPLCRERIKSVRLDNVLERSLKGYEYEEVSTTEEFERAEIKGRRVVFAISQGTSGINLEYYGILKKIRLGCDCLEGCTGAIIADGASEFHTKAAARELALSANMAGCAFVGKSLVEGTGTLKNYNVIAKNLSIGNLEAYASSAEQLVRNLMEFELPAKSSPRILMVHAGRNGKSNSVALWNMVREHLGGVQLEEISLQDGEIKDCIGCPYVACRHFGEQNSCFYGGVITEKVYPSILSCDVLVVVSPNYNDAAPAYVSAFINRLTALFRVNQLSGKMLFAVVVSGYSGGDLVAQQLIGALNMNKPFILPARAMLFETANDPGDVDHVPGIEKIAAKFAENMLKQATK